MSVFRVRAAVWNPEKPGNRTFLELLVDGGATYTVIPASVLKFLDVKPVRSIMLRLADNRVIEKPLGEIGIKIEGYRASATPAVFGDEGVHLLGSVQWSSWASAGSRF